MDSKKWRLVVEIGGMTVVVVSLLVVVFELQQNTAAIRGATLGAVAERQQFELYWSGEIAPVFVKAIQTPDQVNAIEAWQLSEWLTSAMNARVSEYSQYRLGLANEETWLTTKATIQMMLSFEWSQEWWSIYRDGPWDQEFVALVDSIVEESTYDYNEVLEQLSEIGTD